MMKILNFDCNLPKPSRQDIDPIAVRGKPARVAVRGAACFSPGNVSRKSKVGWIDLIPYTITLC